MFKLSTKQRRKMENRTRTKANETSTMRITGRRIIRQTTNSNARPPVQQSIKQTRTQIYKDESMQTEISGNEIDKLQSELYQTKQELNHMTQIHQAQRQQQGAFNQNPHQGMFVPNPHQGMFVQYPGMFDQNPQQGMFVPNPQQGMFVQYPGMFDQNPQQPQNQIGQEEDILRNLLNALGDMDRMPRRRMGFFGL